MRTEYWFHLGNCWPIVNLQTYIICIYIYISRRGAQVQLKLCSLCLVFGDTKCNPRIAPQPGGKGFAIFQPVVIPPLIE